MLWIHQARRRIEEIIVNKHLIPRCNEVDVNIISDLQVTVHPKETREGAIYGIVESDAVQPIKGRISKKIVAS